jgi:transposase
MSNLAFERIVLILQLADGVPISHIATSVGINRRFVYKWVQRFMQDGIAGLGDKPGRGYRHLSHPHDVLSPNGTLVG